MTLWDPVSGASYSRPLSGDPSVAERQIATRLCAMIDGQIEVAGLHNLRQRVDAAWDALL
jgi:hypothetical protein